VRTLVLLVVLGGVGLVTAVFVASELGGEVVTLTTADERGVEYQTSLWVVDHGGHSWLRAGSDESGWYRRLLQDPRVRLERNGEVRKYEAVPVPERTERIGELMAAKYGWADWIVGIVRDEEASVAIRLDREW